MKYTFNVGNEIGYAGMLQPGEICDGLGYKLISRESLCGDEFYGREDILETIHTFLGQGNKVVMLKGMGGIGKSEIARQYVKKNRTEYSTVVFARYTTDLRSI